VIEIGRGETSMRVARYILLGACLYLAGAKSIGVVRTGANNAVQPAPAVRPAPDEGRPVKFKGGADHDISAVLFEPTGPGPFPAIVEIHGINGQEPWDFEVSRKLAAEGYVTVAVDLFGRRSKDYADGLHQRDLARPHVPDDLRGAVQYLKTQKNVDPKRIGSLGWCMGGGYTLLLALAEPTLAAGVIYYGPVTAPKEEFAKVNAPLIAFFGQEDGSLPMPAVKMFANNLREAGKHIELHIYPNAGHGFAEPGGHGDSYNPEAAADSWQKTLVFLRTNLHPPSSPPNEGGDR
jgi:carboxymethylenebutenolidase